MDVFFVEYWWCGVEGLAEIWSVGSLLLLLVVVVTIADLLLGKREGCGEWWNRKEGAWMCGIAFSSLSKYSSYA